MQLGKANCTCNCRYNETVGHAIHSITVEGLRLFNRAMTEDNRVPTVNKDLSNRDKLVNDNI